MAELRTSLEASVLNELRALRADFKELSVLLRAEVKEPSDESSKRVRTPMQSRMGQATHSEVDIFLEILILVASRRREIRGLSSKNRFWMLLLMLCKIDLLIILFEFGCFSHVNLTRTLSIMMLVAWKRAKSVFLLKSFSNRTKTVYTIPKCF